METKEKKFAKLGDVNSHTREYVEKLNILIASLHVHYLKLRNFHWNVRGKNFFDLHAKFEEIYNFTKTNIDDLAERVRVFGAYPMATLREYLAVSKITEPKGQLTSDEMVDQILTDFEILQSQMMSVLETADSLGDVSTTDMVNDMAKATEKYYWMFTAWLDGRQQKR